MDFQGRDELDRRYMRRARHMIKAFEVAVREHEMKGSYHPEDWDDIEACYKKHRNALIEKIYNLIR